MISGKALVKNFARTERRILTTTSIAGISYLTMMRQLKLKNVRPLANGSVEHSTQVSDASSAGTRIAIHERPAASQACYGTQGLGHARKSVARADPGGRVAGGVGSGETIDIANAAAFLASDGASFVNGHDFVIDGGLTTNVVGWSEGLALRSEPGVAIKAAAAG